MPFENTEHGTLLAPFRCILGTDVLEAIRGAECLEATLLRTLCHASIRLWTKGDLPFPEQELALFLRSPQLHALLPLALWQSSAPIPQSLERRTSIHSMMSCISGNSTLASSKKRQEKEQKMGNHVWRLY